MCTRKTSMPIISGKSVWRPETTGIFYPAEGFARLERQEGYLENPIFSGSWGEDWTLRKLLRRFLWHDRIHAKAMYRMALRTFDPGTVPDVFRFAD